MYHKHCVKSVRIWSYSGPHFSRIFPCASLHIQSECGKMQENGDQNNSEYGNFLRSEILITMSRVKFLKRFQVPVMLICIVKQYQVLKDQFCSQTSPYLRISKSTCGHFWSKNLLGTMAPTVFSPNNNNRCPCNDLYATDHKKLIYLQLFYVPVTPKYKTAFFQ